MKKAKIIPFFLILMLTVFCLGFLLGRNFKRSDLLHNGSIVSVDQFTEKSAETSTASTGPRKVNINRASAEELTLLPGIGPSLAQKIIDHREENGMFRSIDDLGNVEGIGEKKLLAIWDYISLVG